MTGTEPTTPQPPLAAATDLHKRYGAVAALRGASFDVRPGEVHGLCGHNGAGKSTLMKAMVGLERPDSGTLAVDGEEIVLTSVQAAQRAGIAILDQELSVVAELTVAENLFLGNVTEPFWVSDADRNRRATELLDAVGLGGIPPDRPVEHTSLGERQLIEIARLLGRDAKVLILDEPTATLTDAEIAFVFASIRRVVAGGAGVVFVSHRLDEVLEICDRVTVLRDGATVATRPVAEMTKDDLVTLMLGEPARSRSRAAGPPAADDRAAGNGLSVRSLRVGDRVAGFDLDIAPGTVVGLAGQLGSGAGDVLAAVAGLAPDVDGTVRVAGRTVRPADPSDALAAGVHYVSDDRKGRGLFGMQSIEANLVSTRLDRHATAGVLRAVGLRRAARRLADLVGIDRRRLGHPVGTLSGGNQQKVFVGRCLDRSDLRVLLLDEPTRGVDVGGRAEIHDLVRRATDDGAAVLFASTELDEVLDLADVVVTLFAGRTVSVRDRATTSSAEVFREMTHRPETAEIGGPA